MATVPFSKVEGLGNDFVVVDLRPGRPAATAQPSPADPEIARALCDRHFGIGADGVLAILPGQDGDARMRVINADGSEAEMCGNGLRCVVKVLHDTDPALKRPLLRIDTGAGLLACAVQAEGGLAKTVTVQMGRPRLLRGEIPMTGPADERVVRSSVRVGDRAFSVTAVSMGNPHAIIFVDEDEGAGADLRALAETWGPKLEVDAVFPKRTNVEFARVRRGGAQEIDLVVWERGCGITLACGTGACATAVAACIEGRVQAGRETRVNLPGGPLFITVSPEVGAATAAPAYSGVEMRGPAEVVFSAEVDLRVVAERAKGRGI